MKILSPTSFLLTFAALALTSVTTQAATTAHIKAPEAALEVRLSAVRWPANADGPVLVTPCPGCVTRSFAFDGNAVLTWNGAPISLEALRQRPQAGPAAALTLIYRRATGRIVRIIGHD